MSSGPKTTVWDVKPHTRAKIDILQDYLYPYFCILGTARKQDILYVDGFAGPDEYSDQSRGSPTAALNAANKAIASSDKRWIAGDVHCIFVENDKDRYEHLVQKLSEVPVSSRIKVKTFNLEFADALNIIQSEYPAFFVKDYPLFVFIDPFGATGSPFDCIASILNSPCSELLINFDADGIARIFDAKLRANAINLTRIFGDSSWKSALVPNATQDTNARSALKLFKQKLRSLPDVKYVFEFEMRGKSNALNYFLTFASKHPLGLIKMKEAMKKIDQNGAYTFSDAHVDQSTLFQFNESGKYAEVLYKTFKGQEVEYDSKHDEITAYALNETPFVDAKAMLVILEDQNKVHVTNADPKRKGGTFNESVKMIDFSGGYADGRLF